MAESTIPQLEMMACTIVEGNGRETETALPIHTTKRGRKWVAASPVKMGQHGEHYIYALFLDPERIKSDGDGGFRYADKLKRADAYPYWDLEGI